MKRVVVMLLVVLMVLTMVACNAKPVETSAAVSQTVASAEPSAEGEASASTETLKPVRFGMITQPLTNIFYVVLMDAIKEYAATMEGVEVTCLDGKDIQDQVKVFEDFAATKPDAIGVAAIDKTAIIPAIQAAKEMGIPTFCVDNESADSARVCYIGTDNFLGSQEATKWIIDVLGGEGKMAIVEGPAGNHNSNIRLDGFHDIFDKGGHTIEVVASVTANWRRDEALNVTNDLLTANPDLDLIYCLNDEMASGAMEAIKGQGRTEVILIGYNGVPEAIKNVYDGGFQATVVQYPELMAKTYIDSALALVRDGVQPPDTIPIVASVVDTELIKQVVDENLAATNDNEELLYAKLKKFYQG